MGDYRTHNPQIKNRLPIAETLEIRMISRGRCAERDIAKRNAAIQAQPEPLHDAATSSKRSVVEVPGCSVFGSTSRPISSGRAGGNVLRGWWRVVPEANDNDQGTSGGGAR